MVLIRNWTLKDIDYVAESVTRENWGHTRRDVERCWQCEPDGCFIAEDRGKPVGHVFSVTYGRVGWIGLLIVNEEERGKGVGTILMENAIKHLLDRGASTITLEAVEKAVPLYKRLGFKEEFASLRFKKQLKLQNNRKTALSDDLRTLRAKTEDLEDVASFDSRYFGSNRERVLQSLYHDQPQQCLVARALRTAGYIMWRDRLPDSNWIGPWVCEDRDIAEHLLHACERTINRETELRLGMPAPNKDGVTLMEKAGFQLIGKSIRMTMGGRGGTSDVSCVYGIGGAEKG